MGGDHKCPLCSATFTRPQHVGRHLRAHTGDRPYECRECPLRFARSDLLSRHVNKAHPKPTIDGQPAPPPKKAAKKGRRKSMPNIGGVTGDTEESGREDPPSNASSRPSTQAKSRPPTAQLTAQRMYPHHPLLSGSQPSSGYATDTSTQGNQIYVPGVGFVPPFATGLNAGAEHGYAGMGAQQLAMAGIGYELGYKKRACDQCNHSKVRCDFAEPCARCALRSLGCTYSKPQRTRTVGYPTGPSTNQNPNYQSPMSATFAPSARGSNQSSTSPQSYTSPMSSTGSPYSNNATVNSQTLAALGPAFDRRRNSIATLSPMYNNPLQATPILTSEPWTSAYTSTSNPLAGNEMWQSPMSAVPSRELYTSPVSAVPQDLKRSGSLNRGPVNLYATVTGAAGSSNSSPQLHFSTTPSLTNTTSPAASEDLAEKNGMAQIAQTYTYNDPTLGQTKSLPYMDPNYNIQNYNINHAVDPSVDLSVSPLYSTYTQDLPPTTYNWKSGTIDPRFQFQQPFVSDDEEPSGANSSTASNFGLDEATMMALNDRRRSSVGGIWANAFNQMSLQDQGNVAAAVAAASESNGNGANSGNIINDPFTISQIAQEVQQRRPTFPIYHQNGLSTDLNPTDSNGSNDGRLSSLSDVKDIWKMFMTEPMTSTNLNGATPLLEKHNEMENGVPILTPRPGLGKRNLSRSNSLPDLTSPLLQGPAFFSNFLNGITPKQSDVSQTSYMPDHGQTGVAEEGKGGENGVDGGVKVEGEGEDPNLMKKWKNEIQHRVDNFNMRMGDNLGHKSALDGIRLNQSTGSTMLPPRYNPQTGRPLASVLQHSSALQQTLAPERVPSFGMPMIHDLHSSPSSLSTFKSPHRSTHGVPTSVARPGNKRLASQTLGPDQQKKGTFDMWDNEGDDDGTLGDAEDDSGFKSLNQNSSPFIRRPQSQPQGQLNNLATPLLRSFATPTMASHGQFDTPPMFYQNWQPTQTAIP